VSEAPTFDLQSHSTVSDGELAPAEVVAAAARAGVELLALTDHDAVDGIDEASLAAEAAGIRLVPAVEISSVDGTYEDLHVLGYRLDHADAALLAALEDSRADRERRIFAMAERLRELGLELDDAPLQARRAAGRSLGRPHLARAVLAHPANAGRLEEEGIDGLDTIFPAYLVPGARAYVPRSRPTVADAIALIHDAGGVAVWAHPFFDISDPATTREALARFAASGIDGVEAFYSHHDQAQTLALADAAAELGLLTTGSSDFHGPGVPGSDRFLAFELYGRAPALGPIG
jgi:predicted metal-dependent phosphoesterase TrpH